MSPAPNVSDPRKQYKIVMTRAAYHFYGKFPGHPIVTGRDIYPVVEKTDAQRTSDLEAVNRYVNNVFTSTTDIWNRVDAKIDNWSFLSIQARKYGDCEDFVITKIQMLLELGWSIEHLKIETGFREADIQDMQETVTEWVPIEGHAWLVAQWDNNEFVLDNEETELLSRADIKQIWDVPGATQIEGRRWVFRNKGSNEIAPDTEFEIEPVPYTQVRQKAINLIGGLKRK